MSRKASPTTIGAFVIGALILLLIGIVVFGSGKFFVQTLNAVVYFEGDLKGLREGASVDFEGVPIGTVTDIGAVLNPQDLSARIPVVVEILRDHFRVLGGEDALPGEGRALKPLVEQKGLRAQLQLESLVTGQLFIQLAFHPEEPPKQLTVDPLTNLPEIPTIPTAMQEVQETVRKALVRFGELPVAQIAANLNNSLQGIDRMVNAPEVLEAIRNLNMTLSTVQQLVQNIDKQVTPIAASAKEAFGSVSDAMGNVGKLAKNVDGQVPALVGNLKETLSTAQGALQRTQETLTSVNDMMVPNSPIRYELVKTLQELTGAARALRMLTSYLERYPNAVVFGRNEGSAK